MCPDPLGSQKGFGLMTAIFVITVLATFGLLIARYTTTTQISSAEDYLWTQALYSAESTMRLNILSNDGGGGLGGVVTPNIQGFDFTTAGRVTDDFSAAGAPATIRVQANHPTGVSRTVEAKYML